MLKSDILDLFDRKKLYLNLTEQVWKASVLIWTTFVITTFCRIEILHEKRPNEKVKGFQK